jgi:hypothetical protein
MYRRAEILTSQAFLAQVANVVFSIVLTNALVVTLLIVCRLLRKLEAYFTCDLNCGFKLTHDPAAGQILPRRIWLLQSM